MGETTQGKSHYTALGRELKKGKWQPTAKQSPHTWRGSDKGLNDSEMEKRRERWLARAVGRRDTLTLTHFHTHVHTHRVCPSSSSSLS